VALIDNLTAYWKLDEASGSRSDSAGGGYTATDSGSTGSTTGKISNAASFSATTYLAVADTAALRTGDVDFSMSAWVKLTDKSASYAVFSKYDSTVGDAREFLLIYTTATDRFRFIVSSDGLGTGNVVVDADNLGSPSAGTWYHIVAWHDATANTINIVVDDGTVDSLAHTLGVYSGTFNLNIGSHTNTAAQMSGAIDELGYWHKVLSAAEITQLYNGGAGLAYPFRSFTQLERGIRGLNRGIYTGS